MEKRGRLSTHRFGFAQRIAAGALRYAAKGRRLLRASGWMWCRRGIPPLTLSRPRLFRGRIEGCLSRPDLVGEAAHFVRGGLLGCVLLASCGGDNGPIAAPKPDDVMPQVLTGDEVGAIMQQAARAVPREMAVAVTDRRGVILGVGTNFPLNYAVACAPCPPTDIALNGTCADCGVVNLAVQLARTGSFFSADETPLTTRSVRFLSGVHFPPGIQNTAAAALFGIENTNRGCSFDAATNPLESQIPRPRSLLAQLEGLPCEDGLNSSAVSGCTAGIATLPGGVPIYKNGRMAGGVGVALRNVTLNPCPVAARDAPTVVLRRDDQDPAFTVAEFAARAFAGDRLAFPTVVPKGLPGVCANTPGITTPACCASGCFLGILPAASLPFDPVIFVDGVEIPEIAANPPVSGVGTGTLINNFIIAPPTSSTPIGEPAASQWLIGPNPSTPGAQPLTADEVRHIIDTGVAQAHLTRAAIRLPLQQRTAMVLAVSDTNGVLIGLFRMSDATVFSIDVAVAKARNVIYFSSSQIEDIDTEDCPGTDAASCSVQPFFAKGTAISNRTLGFAAQPFFPSGIDGTVPGPFRRVFIDDSSQLCTNGQQPSAQFPGRKNGIVFFPGSAPLYRNGTLVGGLGVSGDGVEQDDVVTAAGLSGFDAPAAIRADQVFVRGVRLPYLKFNRKPEE